MDKYYYLRQKLIGVVLLVASVILIAVSEDITPTLITVPLGLGCLFSKERLTYSDEDFGEYEEEEL